MLYIVATPIGNRAEITFRAVETLKAADVILCEDTRHSAPLLRHYGVQRPLLSYQKFNERARSAEIIGRLQAGENVALISDAGMPLISDPGSVLLREVVAAGLEYTVISGPCACINAVVLSGLDTSAFCFAGFLPEKQGERERFLDRFAALTCTLVFYSPPHDLTADLQFLAERLGRRPVAVVREISKLHEQVVRGTLGDALDVTPRGECVIVVAGADAPAAALTARTVEQHYQHYLDCGFDRKEAVKAVARDRGVAGSVIYKATLGVGEASQEKRT